MSKLNKTVDHHHLYRLLGDAELVKLLFNYTGGIERTRDTKNAIILTFPKIPTMSLHISNAMDKEH